MTLKPTRKLMSPRVAHWRNYLWRNWPDRLVVLMLFVGPVPRFGEIPTVSPFRAVTFMSPWWARPGVCKR